MTCGVESKSVDLDLIFDALRSGQPQARATGATILDANSSARWAPLSAGSAAAVTGIEDQGADFNTLYAKIGTSGGTPAASFTHTTSALAATFTDTSTDPGGTIGSWAWNFGDGTTSTAQNPSHTYGAAGSYNVELTVTDSRNGKQSSTTQSVSVASGVSPENGQTFSASNVTASTGGTAVGILLTFTNATTYQFTGWQAQVLGTFTVPAGATKFTAVLTYVSGSTTAQTVEDTPTATAIASGVQLLDLNIGAYSGTPSTRTCTYSCVTTWQNAAGSVIATGTSTLHISSQLT